MLEYGWQRKLIGAICVGILVFILVVTIVLPLIFGSGS